MEPNLNGPLICGSLSRTDSYGPGESCLILSIVRLLYLPLGIFFFLKTQPNKDILNSMRLHFPFYSVIVALLTKC